MSHYTQNVWNLEKNSNDNDATFYLKNMGFAKAPVLNSAVYVHRVNIHLC